PPDVLDVPVGTEIPRDPSHGDIASNVAMVLTKHARRKPRDIAEKIAAKLAAADDIAKVEVAGPGFLNITCKPEVWHALIAAILKAGPGYGRTDLGKGAKVNVEYVSTNPTGPLHVGHCRGAVFGDALANLLTFTGHAVTREYYVNDAGAQVDVLAQSAYLRYKEALGEDIGPIPEGLYPGEYLKPVGRALVETHGKKLRRMAKARWLPIVRTTAVEHMMAQIKDDLARLAIRHDVFFSERSLIDGGTDEVAAAVAELDAKGLIYRGRLPKPKGHDDANWEDREQTLFKSTQFGDDEDRALMKSDGSYTYFASDIAYHRNKLERGFDHPIDVLGADHAGHIKRLKAIVTALSGGAHELEVRICNLVKLLRGGTPVIMSKRAGTFIPMREIVDEVGPDAVRFMMLYRKNDSELEFDLVKVREQSKDNPVFYVQYAHARVASVFRNAMEIFPHLARGSAAVRGADLSLLQDAGEIDIVRRLASFPKTISTAARDREPHRIAFYLYDVASALHQQWSRGNESPHLRFIQPENERGTAARLALIAATQQVIASGLAVLGVGAPEEMR
ncbi:MAG: arginine--tRNA ligase, partial [Hyphomicrobiaceae bacterium]